MADDVSVKDSAGAAKVFRTTDAAGIHTPHHIVSSVTAGASADIGAVADAAVVTDTTGSLSGKLRGLVKIFAERFPAALGQGTKAQSLSVTLASNQDALQLTAGSQSIGGVKDNGPFYTVIQETPVTSADATAGLTITVAPGAGLRTVIDELLISVDTDMSVTIAEVSGATLSPPIFMKAKEPFQLITLNRLRCVSVDKQVKVTASIAGNIGVRCSRHEE